MRIFKQEQMFMVEEYHNLKVRDKKKEIALAKAEKIIMT